MGGGARKRQPQASGTGEKRNRAAHGAPTEPGLLHNAPGEPRPTAGARHERRLLLGVGSTAMLAILVLLGKEGVSEPCKRVRID
jgi:hypothetical protein